MATKYERRAAQLQKEVYRIHSSFVYVGALAVQPTESTKWKLVIELPAVFELEVSRFREVPRTRTRNKSHRKYEPGIGALFVQPHHH